MESKTLYGNGRDVYFELSEDAQRSIDMFNLITQINDLTKQHKEIKDNCPHNVTKLVSKATRQGKFISEGEFISSPDIYEQVSIEIHKCLCCLSEIEIYPCGKRIKGWY